MLSSTLSEGLERYRIGPKIRELRVRKKLSLAQLGSHSGLSTALLSKIERSQLFPTLPTLLRIALVFGVGLEAFIAPEADRPLVSLTRKRDRIRLPDRPASDAPSYFFESLDFSVSGRKMEAYRAEFPLGSRPSEPHRHEGAEMIYVVTGQLGLSVEGESHSLGEGDSVYFDSAAAHGYRREGRRACSAIVVVAK